MITKNQIKFIKSLSLKKNRQKERLFIAEGEKIVAELLNSNFECYKVFATNEWILKNADIRTIKVTISEMDRISNLKSANNVLAIVKMKQENLPITDGLTLVLDDISDPGNLGTIIRMCDWFGVKKIVCSKSTVDCFNPKVVQSAMGSLFRVPIIYTHLEEYITKVDTPIYGACINGENVRNVKIPETLHLIMGNEANGISEVINNLITDKVAIKNIGKSAESLNVAIATSILLYELCN